MSGEFSVDRERARDEGGAANIRYMNGALKGSAVNRRAKEKRRKRFIAGDFWMSLFFGGRG